MTITVLPATPERWADVGRAFGPRAADPDSCWCQRFRAPVEGSHRDELHREIEAADDAVGLIAYVDDEAVGWTRVVPRETLAGITSNRALQRVLTPDPDAWWVSCFVVRRENRGTGVGDALLRSAVEWAREHGASVLDGHPVDVMGLAGKPSASALFTGTVAMFRAVGFEEIGRTYPTRPVMRRVL